MKVTLVSLTMLSTVISILSLMSQPAQARRCVDSLNSLCEVTLDHVTDIKSISIIATDVAPTEELSPIFSKEDERYIFLIKEKVEEYLICSSRNDLLREIYRAVSDRAKIETINMTSLNVLFVEEARKLLGDSGYASIWNNIESVAKIQAGI